MSAPSKIVTEYFTQYHAGDSTPPPAKGLAVIAEKLDTMMESVIRDFSQIVKASPEHTARVQAIKGMQRCAGAYKQSKIIMKDVSEFEQMLAFEGWLNQTNIRSVHTFHLGASLEGSLNKDDHIPVSVRPRDGGQTGMMHMMLGATQGERVAPKYTDWSENDPFDTAEQQVFIRPLRTLEVIRQPRFSFAKVMKELSQEEDLIDNTWAYGKKYWSVEGPGQSRPATARSQKFKSAALNALSVVEEYSSTDDPEAKEVKITPDVDFTEYFDDGYDDDLDVSIYAADIVKAVESSIVKKNEESLKRIMENMAVQFIGPVKTRELSERFLEVIKRSDRA